MNTADIFQLSFLFSVVFLIIGYRMHATIQHLIRKIKNAWLSPQYLRFKGYWSSKEG